jgi:uncharacterized damage-inducible protein DinB
MSLKEASVSIQQTTDQIIAACQGLSEDVLKSKPAEDQWSVLEVLCHLEEAIPYWLQELQAAITSPETPWGRGLQHEGRLAAVAGAHERQAADVFRGLQAAKQQVEEVLGSISEESLQVEVESRNPRFGKKPLSFIVQHLLVEHLVTHLKQIERNVSALK